MDDTSLILSPHCHSVQCDISAITGLGSPQDAARSLHILVPDTLTRAVDKRLYEFIAGRYCATTALRKAGYSGHEAIEILTNRAPRWPQGFVGSIAHCETFAWAVVARVGALQSIGIDAEGILSAEAAQEIQNQVLLPQERSSACKGPLSDEQYTTLLFSAKESLYKCLSPYVGEYFGFEFASCTNVDYSRRELVLTLTANLPGDSSFFKGANFSARFEITTIVRTIVEHYLS